jgi:hypothetical protein
VHLYGKQAARVGRKMGHITALAPTSEEAVNKVLVARRALQRETPAAGSAPQAEYTTRMTAPADPASRSGVALQ